jgi:hypothetical protein
LRVTVRAAQQGKEMIRPFVAWRFRRGFSAGLLWMPGRGHRAHSHVPGADGVRFL